MLPHNYLSLRLVFHTPQLALKLVSGVKHVFYVFVVVFFNPMMSENAAAEVNLSVCVGAECYSK